MKKELSAKRVGLLLDTTLLQYCETINLIDDTSVCDAMFKHLVIGDLDKEFLSPNIKKEERENAFDIARKYNYLCFYDGNIKYWQDSVAGFNPSFPSELIAERILDNYNFLLELANEKGEKAVAELTNFVGSGIDEESTVIDSLRNRFNNDKLLKVVLNNTANFNELNTLRKSILYKYPEGVLYIDYDEKDSEDFKTISEDELIGKIADISNDGIISRMDSLTEVADYLDNDTFESIIRDIHLNYLNKNKKIYR